MSNRKLEACSLYYFVGWEKAPQEHLQTVPALYFTDKNTLNSHLIPRTEPASRLDVLPVFSWANARGMHPQHWFLF